MGFLVPPLEPRLGLFIDAARNTVTPGLYSVIAGTSIAVDAHLVLKHVNHEYWTPALLVGPANNEYAPHATSRAW